MIDVKEAVKVAHDYTRELYKDYGVGEVDPITLEEVELTDDERFWLITLGMYRSELPTTTTGPCTTRRYNRRQASGKTGKGVQDRKDSR